VKLRTYPLTSCAFGKINSPPFILRKVGVGTDAIKKKDIEQILLIKNLLYRNGFTIQGAQKELKKKKDDLTDDITIERLKEILKTLE